MTVGADPRVRPVRCSLGGHAGPSLQETKMIPAQFDYVRANTLDEAVSLLAQNEDAKILAGGHSLIPA